jgi:hypothetical protein
VENGLMFNLQVFDGEEPILFEVKVTDEYIDTSQTFISFKVKFTKNAGMI